jgi:hypothetical protein
VGHREVLEIIVFPFVPNSAWGQVYKKPFSFSAELLNKASIYNYALERKWYSQWCIYVCGARRLIFSANLFVHE